MTMIASRTQSSLYWILEFCNCPKKSRDRALRGADCVAILTAHDGVDYRRVVRSARVVFDTRNATKGIRSSKVIRL